MTEESDATQHGRLAIIGCAIMRTGKACDIEFGDKAQAGSAKRLIVGADGDRLFFVHQPPGGAGPAARSDGVGNAASTTTPPAAGPNRHAKGPRQIDKVPALARTTGPPPGRWQDLLRLHRPFVRRLPGAAAPAQGPHRSGREMSNAAPGPLLLPSQAGAGLDGHDHAPPRRDPGARVRGQGGDRDRNGGPGSKQGQDQAAKSSHAEVIVLAGWGATRVDFPVQLRKRTNKFCWIGLPSKHHESIADSDHRTLGKGPKSLKLPVQAAGAPSGLALRAPAPESHAPPRRSRRTRHRPGAWRRRSG